MLTAVGEQVLDDCRRVLGEVARLARGWSCSGAEAAGC